MNKNRLLFLAIGVVVPLIALAQEGDASRIRLNPD